MLHILSLHKHFVKCAENTQTLSKIISENHKKKKIFLDRDFVSTLLLVFRWSNALFSPHEGAQAQIFSK